MEEIDHISDAIAKAGGPVETARATGASSYQVVQQWARSANVPPEYVLALEAASGVSRFLLCKTAHRIWPELAQADTAETAE